MSLWMIFPSMNWRCRGISGNEAWKGHLPARTYRRSVRAGGVPPTNPPFPKRLRSRQAELAFAHCFIGWLAGDPVIQRNHRRYNKGFPPFGRFVFHEIVLIWTVLTLRSLAGASESRTTRMPGFSRPAFFAAAMPVAMVVSGSVKAARTGKMPKLRQSF